MFNPSDAPMPHKAPLPLDERLARLEQAIQARDGALVGAFDERLQRVERQVERIAQLQAEHHFVLQDTLAAAPAVNRQLGDLYRAIAERMNTEHQQLQQARTQVAQELESLSKAAAEVRQLVNDSLPATHEASDHAIQSLALLANDVKVERGALRESIGEVMHETMAGQTRLVLVVGVLATLVSSMVVVCAFLLQAYS